jgi:predicted transcriptional regulator of viral defense system
VFAEMPNSALSVNEASALAGVEPQICFGILCALEDVRFLSRVSDGRYRRRADDPMD